MATKDIKTTKEVKAFARYIHVSPRKLRLVADLIRRTPVDAALEQLRFSSKNAALPLTKVINSAVANALHNFNLNKEDLFIKSLTIDGGPVLRKYVPRAQGRAFVNRKRTSHINLILESKARKNKTRRSIFSIRPASLTPELRKHADHSHAEDVDTSKNQNRPKQVPRGSELRKNNLISLKRRLFNRKSGE
ncbi:MAG: 50S ribosomal protein L22 [bacterium]|nr:50S ribosomal protein L22 [bacterium]